MHVYLLLLPEEFPNFLDLLIPYSTISFNVKSGIKKNNNNVFVALVKNVVVDSDSIRE